MAVKATDIDWSFDEGPKLIIHLIPLLSLSESRLDLTEVLQGFIESDHSELAGLLERRHRTPEHLKALFQDRNPGRRSFAVLFNAPLDVALGDSIV